MNNIHRSSALLIGSLVSAAALAADVPSLRNSEAVAARFIISADALTVRDSEPTLIWQRSRSPDALTWEGAYDYCGSLRIAGFESDWRLPKLIELLSLIVEPTEPKAAYIDSEAFPNTPSEFFWSASASDTDVAAVVFNLGAFPSGSGPEMTLGNVRCVRGTVADSHKVPDSASHNIVTIPRSAAR